MTMSFSWPAFSQNLTSKVLEIRKKYYIGLSFPFSSVDAYHIHAQVAVNIFNLTPLTFEYALNKNASVRLTPILSYVTPVNLKVKELWLPLEFPYYFIYTQKENQKINYYAGPMVFAELNDNDFGTNFLGAGLTFGLVGKINNNLFLRSGIWAGYKQPISKIDNPHPQHFLSLGVTLLEIGYGF